MGTASSCTPPLRRMWQGLAGGTLSLMGELVQQGGKTYVQASIACE